MKCVCVCVCVVYLCVRVCVSMSVTHFFAYTWSIYISIVNV
jgi:hypothetical protein